MAAYGRMLARYQKTNVETAGKIDLVIMCYEKTIQFLHQAKICYQEKQFEEKGRALQKALDIISELKCSLDFEKGEQIAKNLDAIYNYLTGRLLQADTRRDLTAFDESIRIMGELKGAWEGLGSGKGDRIDTGQLLRTGRTNPAQLAA